MGTNSPDTIMEPFEMGRDALSAGLRGMFKMQEAGYRMWEDEFRRMGLLPPEAPKGDAPENVPKG